MTIQIDTREHADKIGGIVEYFNANKIKHFSSKLFVGDYMNLDNPRHIVDRKHNLSEVANNLTNDSGRFMREVRLAHEHGIQLTVLVEHGGHIKSLNSVANWNNPLMKKFPYAITGRELMERMIRVHMAYGVDWAFCGKQQTGKKIVEILDPEYKVIDTLIKI